MHKIYIYEIYVRQYLLSNMNTHYIDINYHSWNIHTLISIVSHLLTHTSMIIQLISNVTHTKIILVLQQQMIVKTEKASEKTVSHLKLEKRNNIHTSFSFTWYDISIITQTK